MSNSIQQSKGSGKLLKELGSLRWTVVILALMIAVMAYATYVESVEDHTAALKKGFHSLPMDILIAALAINISACTISRAPYRPHQYPWLLTHIGILIIMAGAIISHRTARQGQIVLRSGQPQNAVRLFNDSGMPRFEPLGFTLALDSFHVKYYPGTGKAADYVSYIRVHDPADHSDDTLVVRVNHPLVKNGWNLSQSSFFPGDDRATVLGANRDPGTYYSYTGFVIVFLGMVGIFFLKPRLKKTFPPPRRNPPSRPPTPQGKEEPPIEEPVQEVQQ